MEYFLVVKSGVVVTKLSKNDILKIIYSFLNINDRWQDKEYKFIEISFMTTTKSVLVLYTFWFLALNLSVGYPLGFPRKQHFW